jgi:ATP-binding cassette subfamily C protein
MVGPVLKTDGVLKPALDACRDHLRAAFAFSALVNILYLSPSLFMLQVYDRVLLTGGLFTLGFLLLVLVAALGTLAWLDAMRGRILTRAGLRLDRTLSSAVVRASLASDASPRTREAVRDLDAVRQAIAGAPAIAVFDAPWAIFFVAICFLMHWAIGLFALAGCIALAGAAMLNEQSQQRSLKRVIEIGPGVYAGTEADLAGADAAKALGMREALVKRAEARRRPLIEAQAASAFVQSGWGAGARLLRLFLQSAILALGAVLAIMQQISPGAMIAATIIAARALAPLEQIVGSWRALVQGWGSWRNLETLLNNAPANIERFQLQPPAGKLALENLVVTTPDGTRPVLKGVSFTVEAGEIVGVVGPSGAGKTTLARAIVGAAACHSGVVRIDGADRADWDPERLARHIGYLPQDVSLFDGTIAENIGRFASLGAEPDPTFSDDVIATAKRAGAHDMILRLPEGYDTRLGLRGAGLSAGQSQRIALARALFRDPVLLVLDEPNAHLDGDGAMALFAALGQARERGAATIVIAHRPEILEAANKILVLRDGRVAQYGPRDDIMKMLTGRGANVGQTP